MLSWFNYWGHMCLVFELLALSVFDFLVRGCSVVSQIMTVNNDGSYTLYYVCEVMTHRRLVVLSVIDIEAKT